MVRQWRLPGSNDSGVGLSLVLSLFCLSSQAYGLSLLDLSIYDLGAGL